MQTAAPTDEDMDTTTTRQDATAARAIEADRIAQQRFQRLQAAELRKPPHERTSDGALWKQARREGKRQERRDRIAAAAKAKGRQAATNLAADTRSAAHRNRAQLAPWLITAPYAVVGEAAHVVPHVTDVTPAGSAAVTAAAAVGASAAAWKRVLADRVPAAFRSKVQAGLGMLCGWTAAMPVVPTSDQAGMWLALVGGTAWMGLSWWRTHDHPIPVSDTDLDTPAPAPAAEDQDVEEVEAPTEMVEGILTAWRDRVADGGGAVPGSTITYTATKANSVRFLVRLDQTGQVTPGNIDQRVERIALAVGVHSNQIQFATGRPGEVELRVTLGSQGRAYDGPQVLCDGKPISSRWEITPGSSVDIVVGPYLDGEDYAAYRVIDGGSVNSAFALGSIGSGKTMLAEVIAIGLRFIGAEIWYVDGQSGASSEMLKRCADWYVPNTPEDIDELYRAVKRVAEGRNTELATRPELENKYQYDPARPPIIVMLEECQEVFGLKSPDGSATYGQLFGAEARKIRKDGMGFVAVSQDLDMGSTFGNSDQIRNCLMAGGNFFAMRFTSSARKGMLPPNCPDLRMVPKNGFGYAPFGSRPGAMWRSDNLDASSRSRIEWMQSYPAATLDELSRRMAGRAYRLRHERAEEALEAYEAKLERLMTADEDELDDLLADDGGGQSSTPQNRTGSTGTGSGGAAGVVRFPFAGATSEAAEGDVTSSQRRVLDVLTAAGEAMNAASVGRGMSVSRQAAAKHLDALARSGHVVRLEDGRYMAR